MISVYPPDSLFRVYSQQSYVSDTWDAMDAGRLYDFSRPFFDQFHDLLLAVPRRGLQQGVTNENCDYTTYGGGNKNCYLTASCMYCEDTYFSTRCGMVKDSADCFICVNGELLYECIYCIQCYHLLYSKDCYGCSDSLLLDHCHNCKHCIACKNLRNKEYFIYNKSVTPEEYAAYESRLLAGAIEEERQRFDAWKLTLPCLYAHLTRAEDVTGDYIDSAKHCFVSFGLQAGAEDCRYCQFCGLQFRDAVDCVMAGPGELLYEVAGVGPGQRSAFVSFAVEINEVYYCDDLSHCTSCFGCTGLQNKSYCIFNKQYIKDAYERLVPEIIAHMRTTGEWGEFFPVSHLPFGYNETVADEYFPLTKEEVIARGWQWHERTEPVSNEQAQHHIKQELAFYAKMGITPPTLRPLERHRRRAQQCNPHHLWDRQCAKCQKSITTSYSPERPEIVYCESCYLAEVY